LLVNERLPLELPVTEGRNSTENVVLCPADSVSGKVRPLIEYPLPVAAAAETVTEPPEAVSVSVKLAVLATVTFPKLSDVGETLKVVVGGATPVPVKVTVGFVDALLVNEICPEALLADPGANCTV
jgi:hypothetical protein